MYTSYRSPFTTLRVEGAILPPDLLQRIAGGDHSIEGLTPEAYHLENGEKLNEAINRAWNRLVGTWATFRDTAANLSESDPGTTVTRERWLLPLFQELGYGRLQAAKAIEIDEGAGSSRPYPISHAWQKTPIHLVGLRVDLDTRTKGVAGAARNSPHSLVQVLLNRSPEHLWAFVSNGLRLRILRDNASLTQQAYVEFELQAMMEGQAYSDFVLLWLLCHESRVEANRPEECWLEKWSRAAAEQGTRALDQLRDGVQDAIVALGRGFLAYPTNRSLRDKLAAGTLDAQDYYRQLLRLVYRLIFLFVAEDRGLLLEPDAEEKARERYMRFYSTARLREFAGKRRGTRHADLYHALRLVMEKLGDEAGCPELALTARGGFLFSGRATPDLKSAEIANYDLLDAIRALAIARDRSARRVVDYKNLGSEELGSVYESLLELHPILNADAARAQADVARAGASNAGAFELKTASGNERKTTGSFYTPTSLINVLLDSALDPVLEQATRSANPEQAILGLKVCDGAAGSGHILIAAARRTAKRLATIRTGDDEPAPEALRAALRDVISHCIYSVDVNEMAVELCKVNLWMEMQDPRYPLSFLDAHIKCGNSLIGVAPWMDISEIPDEAFNPVTGDHKPTASALKKQNKAERSGQLSFDLKTTSAADDLLHRVAERARQLNVMPEETATQVQSKSEAYRQFLASEEYARKKMEYDLWTASFFWQINVDPRSAVIIAPTQGELARLRRHENLNPDLVRGVQALAERLRFFHWELEFPEVFEQGGFDADLSNPPWEKVQLEEKQFFEIQRPDIARATSSERKSMLLELEKSNNDIFQKWRNEERDSLNTSHFLKVSGKFPYGSQGNINTYTVFLELASLILSPMGRVGLVIPSGISTDNTTKGLFSALVEKKQLVSLYDFENRQGLFPDVHRGMRFCLITVSGRAKPIEGGEFVYFACQVEDLKSAERKYTLTAVELDLLNPNTRTSPTFRTKHDAMLTKKIYLSTPIIQSDDSSKNEWKLESKQMLNITHDSGNFLNQTQLREIGGRFLPSKDFITESKENFVRLFEGKMVGIYNHRQSSVSYNADVAYRTTITRDASIEDLQNPSFTVKPQFWISEKKVNTLIPEWYKPKWYLGFKRITSSTNERTMIASILPFAGLIDALPVIYFQHQPLLISCLLSNLNSLVFDYLTRTKVGGLQISHFILKQLPAIPPSRYSTRDLEYIAPRVLELVYTAWDMKPFAEDMGYQGEPFRWDEERRAHLRAELDAYYARLYGLTRDELRYILDPKEVYGEDFPGETFRVLKDKEMKLYGEYRTRRLVLEKWDEMENT